MATGKRKREESTTDVADEAAPATDDTVDLTDLPEPAPDGRKHAALLRLEQRMRVLQELADGARPPPRRLRLAPEQLDVRKWKAAHTRTVEAVLGAVGPSLIELDLSPEGNCANSPMPASVAARVVSSCSAGLEELTLTEAPCDESTLASLGKFVALRRVALGGIAVGLRQPLPTQALVSLAGCPLLTDIALSHTDVCDDVVITVAKACPKLARVDLSSCEALTHAAVEALAASCAGLERICLLNCRNIGPPGVQALGACAGLGDANLQNVRGTATGVETFAGACRALRRLSLRGCFLMDADVAALAQLGQLEDLNLAGTEGYDAKTLEAAVAGLKALTSLSLNMLRFPRDGLDAVVRKIAADGSHKLGHLDLNNTDVTRAAVDCFRAQRPSCDISTVNCDRA